MTPQFVSVGNIFQVRDPARRRPLPVLRIPWAMIAPMDDQARLNHCGQSLRRLEERGGLAACEAIAILERRRWREMPALDAYLDLKTRIEKWESEVKAAEPTLPTATMNPPQTPAAPYDSTSDTLVHIRHVAGYLNFVALLLARRGIDHDLSKLHPPEKPLFDQWTPVLAGITYGTPEYTANLENLRPALAHHYANNSHHPEHFPNGVAGMSLLDLVEMFCDWKAAGERHADGGDIMRSIEINTRRYQLDPQLVEILKNTARELGWTKKGVNAE